MAVGESLEVQLGGGVVQAAGSSKRTAAKEEWGEWEGGGRTVPRPESTASNAEQRPADKQKTEMCQHTATTSGRARSDVNATNPCPA